MDRLREFRQPMVTATGIFLGFMLNFTTGWIKDAFTRDMFRDAVISIGIMSCLFLLLLVLFRMLRMNVRTEPEKFYQRTLACFLIGISIPFIAFLIITVGKLVSAV